MTTKRKKTSDPKPATPAVQAAPAPPSDFMIFVHARRVAALAELCDALGECCPAWAIEKAAEAGDYKHWDDGKSRAEFGYTESLITEAITPSLIALRDREIAKFAEMTAAAGK